ncbi:Alpha/beta hydrolase protein [Lasiosphaeria hispida]|uniref:Alpha/beta hydrolase protein n=1 Tax=Lasiosphaeria hispida TaxID=260671 RepID=A0AAJ0HCK9_9PEZI|nr:Alpha/beta hydrolase protein [Lasiosphaeria hispida]
MPYITLRDGAQFYYKDWNPSESTGAVLFSHGWPLSADAWEKQMFFLAGHGYRVIAHDRRGHGRSDQTWDRNDVDNWADDLAELIEKLDLTELVLVGHSTGGAEVARYCTRHTTSRVAKIVFISSVVPQAVQSSISPDGVPISVFDGFREAMLKDRAQFFLEVPRGPFFGFNRLGAKVSEGLIDSWFTVGMQGGLKAVYETTRSWEVDYSGDLKALDIPALVIQGDDDQVVPIKTGALAAIKLLKQGTLKVYPGGAHGIMDTQPEDINNDLLGFLKA